MSKFVEVIEATKNHKHGAIGKLVSRWRKVVEVDATRNFVAIIFSLKTN